MTGSDPTPARRASAEHQAVRLTWGISLGAMAVTAQLVLVWGFEFFPSVDGPAHVHLAHAMYQSLKGDPFYGALVEFNSHFNPNILTQGMLIALMAVAPPFVAEKIWLTLYFASFTVAAGYAVSGISRSSLCLLPLFLFCSISFPLAFGFYNFSFSTVVFLAWFGYWWRHRNAPSASVAVGHAAFAITAYATHIFAFLVTLFGIGTVVLASVILAISRDPKGSLARPREWSRSLLSQSLPPLLGSLPVLAACIHFLFFRIRSGTAAGAAGLSIPLPDRFFGFVTAETFAPYDRTEESVAVGFVVVLLLLMAYLLPRRKEQGSDAPLAVCFGAFLLFYLVIPEQWVVRWMPSRFLPLVFVVLLLWLAALVPASVRRAHWWTMSALGMALLLGSLLVRIEVFAKLDGLYQEYASAAPYVAENSTLIGLRLQNRYQDRSFPSKRDVFIQAGSRLASIRHSVELKNFQGQSNDHPIQFRPGIGATPALGGDPAITSVPPRIRLMEYERRTGRAIDYVLLCGFRDAVEDQRAFSKIDAQLRGNYSLVFTSQPTGFVHVYARCSANGPACTERAFGSGTGDDAASMAGTQHGGSVSNSLVPSRWRRADLR